MRNHGGTHARTRGIIDFSASGSPLSMHPAAADELRRISLSPGEEAAYPPSDAAELRSLLGAFWGFDGADILVGAGAADLIYLVAAEIAREPEARAVICEPAFSEYGAALRAAGMAEGRIVRRLPVDWTAPLVGPVRGVFMASPANPSGVCASFGDIRSLERECEESGGILVLDSCFAQFSARAEETLRRIIRERESFRNLVVLGAFTKFYGMASLRLGYALCFSGGTRRRLAERLRPWAAGGVAQKCASAVLRAEMARSGGRGWTERVRAFVAEEKERFCALFGSAGVSFWRGEANFILFRSERVRAAAKAPPGGEGSSVSFLGACALRSCRDFFGLDDAHFRLGIRSRKENDALFEELSRVLLGRGAEAALPRRRAKVLMVQGTASGAGKSLLVAALCRIFRNDGFSVAPFKSQNMALNSGVTADGREMGRAQIVQAAAAGIEADVRMNPILLKPAGDSRSQVVVDGEALCTVGAEEYFSRRKELLPRVLRAFGSLAEEHDIIVVEGAGSPAEINLRENDIVNMGLAELLDAPVLLCGDIDRGGVFASLYGTCALLSEDERARIKGFVVNKFRGDARLLEGGLDRLAAMTGIPVVGVVPFVHGLLLSEEDSLSERLSSRRGQAGAAVTVFVARLPYLSNFTDFDALFALDFVSVRFFGSAGEYGRLLAEEGTPDLLVLPGTKNAMRAMAFLRETGIDGIVRSFAQESPVVGICGGFQLLGARLCDPDGTEGGERGAVLEALGLLPVETVFSAEKTRRSVETALPAVGGFFSFLSGLPASGYEIHHGRTSLLGGGDAGACVASGFALGTYLHGFFDSPGVLRPLLGALCARKGVPLPAFGDVSSVREAEFGRLERAVRAGLDMAAVYRAMGISR